MDSPDKITFSVVKFLQKPFPNIEKYTIVPDTWINPRDRNIGVLYPKIEDQNTIREFYSTIPSETPSLNWTEYLCELKHTAGSYEDAQIFIKREKNSYTNKRRFSRSDRTTLSNDNRRRKSHDDIMKSKQTQGPSDQDMLFHDTALFMADVGELFLNYSKRINSYIASKSKSNVRAPKPAQTSQAEECETDEDVATEPQNKSVSFKLPPEYDEKDTRWTLRHRELKTGMVQLCENYDIYVLEKQLADIVNFAKNGAQLARLLLPQIFTENALGACTLNGTKAYPHKMRGRPGLDKCGREALLKFVRLWERKKGWTPLNEQMLNRSLRNKLSDYSNQRRKNLQSSLNGDKVFILDDQE